MSSGCFVEQGSDQHLSSRRELLENGDIPRIEARPRIGPELGVEGIGAVLRDELRTRGAAVLQLGAPLPTSDFMALGKLLGEAMPETDPAVQPYVEHGVMLNLVADAGRTKEASRQPFASNFLTLHSEGSGRPAEKQPRFIMLMCCEPGDGSSARTVLVPMESVRRELSQRDADLLSRVRYLRHAGCPTILREVDGSEVFSFRDFHNDPLEWVIDGTPEEAEEVNDALRRLLASMYAPADPSAVEWERGMLVVIDNHRFFHGRTMGDASVPKTPRHLKRLRILG